MLVGRQESQLADSWQYNGAVRIFSGIKRPLDGSGAQDFISEQFAYFISALFSVDITALKAMPVLTWKERHSIYTKPAHIQRQIRDRKTHNMVIKSLLACFNSHLFSIKKFIEVDPAFKCSQSPLPIL